MNCTRCEETGFLNTHQLPDGLLDQGIDAVLEWIETNDDHDVQVCDCCGNGESWYGDPGQHYASHDPRGPMGPYAYNGGLAECH